LPVLPNLLSHSFNSLLAEDLGTVDYIAIGVSLGLTVFIVAVFGYFLWRARNRSEMGANKEMGQVSLAALMVTSPYTDIGRCLSNTGKYC